MRTLLTLVSLAGITFLGGLGLAEAQDKATAQKYEYAMIKWDGPDKIQYILPDKFQYVRMAEKYPLPKDAQAEEYYLAMAANELAKQGWEAMNIDSRRILLHRPLSK